MKKIFILTGEPSGDKLASKVIKEFKKDNSEIEYLSVGGENLEALGIKSIYDLKEITYIGFTNVIKNIFKINKKINETVNAIKDFNPDILFTVDSPDFTLRVAERVKKQNSNILRGFITLQQDLSRTKKNIYEGSPWMAKSFPIEDLFLLPNLVKSLDGHVWSTFYRDVTKQNVELAHKHGLATCVWTVNREKDIIRMIEYGVDGIITDYPKKVQEICKSKNISWF